MTETRIRIDIGGASAEELQRGAEAAQDVFDRAGVDVDAAFAAVMRRDGEENLTADEESLCALYAEADRAAVDACCAGWADKPETAWMGLDDRPGFW